MQDWEDAKTAATIRSHLHRPETPNFLPVCLRCSQRGLGSHGWPQPWAALSCSLAPAYASDPHGCPCCLILALFPVSGGLLWAGWQLEDVLAQGGIYRVLIDMLWDTLWLQVGPTDHGKSVSFHKEESTGNDTD